MLDPLAETGAGGFELLGGRVLVELVALERSGEVDVGVERPLLNLNLKNLESAEGGGAGTGVIAPFPPSVIAGAEFNGGLSNGPFPLLSSLSSKLGLPD